MITYEINVLCDSCEDAIITTPPDDQPDKGAALAFALNSGWTFRQGKILCPKCSTKNLNSK